MQCGDGKGLAEAEVPQRVGLGLGALVVDLVGGEDDRLAGLAEDPDDRLVGVIPTVASTTNSTASATETATSAWAAIRS